ncbi:MAG: hypothetical protein H5U18_13695 [Rhodobacteraceae bacterium]|nr:hypothetical protein [Paracoccaceae bacterium]
MSVRGFLVRLGLLLCHGPLPAGAEGIALPGLAVGMRRVTPVLFVDRAAGPNEIAAIRKRIATAERAVDAAFGGLRASISAAVTFCSVQLPPPLARL